MIAADACRALIVLGRTAGDEDSRAVLSEFARDATADAPGGAGYDCDFALECHPRTVPELERTCYHRFRFVAAVIRTVVRTAIARTISRM